MVILGIDIGTTTICVKAVNADGAEVVSRTVKNDSYILTSDAFERIQNPSRILSLTLELLQKVSAEAGSEIAAIGVTGQMHGILYTDRQGNAVSPLYVWQDQRGALQYRDGLSYAEYIRSVTGYRCAPGYGSATHLYNHINGLVPAGAVSLCTIHDYIAAKLTGLTRPVMHQSDAASLSLYNAKSVAFDCGAIDSIGMDPSFFPPVISDTAFIGKTDAGIPISVAIGDNQASFLGSVSDTERSILVNVGTGSQISVLGSPEAATGAIEARPFLGDTFLLVGCSLCGGRSYALLEKFFRDVSDMCGNKISTAFPFMDRFMKAYSGDGGGLSVSTVFDGTRENPSERGWIAGMDTLNFTPGNLMYAYMHGIARELYDMYKTVSDDGARRDLLVGSGNGIRVNPVLRNVFSSLFGMPLSVPEYREEAAEGAARFARMAL